MSTSFTSSGPIHIYRLPDEQEAAAKMMGDSCHDPALKRRIESAFPQPQAIELSAVNTVLTFEPHLEEVAEVVIPRTSSMTLDMDLTDAQAANLLRMLYPWHDSPWVGPWKLFGGCWMRHHRICGWVRGPEVEE